jgi:hypothetical protein
MAEFNIRTDAVDVEQIMRQIRARIQEKRGVDYTEQQIQELANVKLERFLDPKGVRSDLVEQFKRAREHKLEPFHVHPEPSHGFDADMLYGTHRGVLRLIRRLLNPILKLFFNPNVVIHALHKQTEINSLYEAQFHFLRDRIQQRDELDVLYYELVHNLVLELTRIGIENRNLKMRLESLSSRLDFDERRARALEGVVQYRPGTGPSREPQPVRATASPAQDEARPPQPSTAGSAEAAESTTARRRRRRRRGRRGGRSRPGAELTQAGSPAEVSSPGDSATPPHGDPTAEAAGLPNVNATLARQSGHHDEDSDEESGDDEGPDTSTQ